MNDCDGYCSMGCLQPYSNCKCGPAKQKQRQPVRVKRDNDCDGYCSMGCLHPNPCKCN